MREWGWRSDTGVYGGPKRATAEKGKHALAILTAEWLKALRGFPGSPPGAGPPMKD